MDSYAYKQAREKLARELAREMGATKAHYVVLALEEFLEARESELSRLRELGDR